MKHYENEILTIFGIPIPEKISEFFIGKICPKCRITPMSYAFDPKRHICVRCNYKEAR